MQNTNPSLSGTPLVWFEDPSAWPGSFSNGVDQVWWESTFNYTLLEDFLTHVVVDFANIFRGQSQIVCCTVDALVFGLVVAGSSSILMTVGKWTTILLCGVSCH
jgi:hypothetical protein